MSSNGQPVHDAVGPLRARIVRQDSARGHLVPLDELPVGRGGVPVPAQRTSGAAAYDDLAPGLYVYRLRRDGEEHVAVVGDMAVEAFVDDRVRGHEAVRPDRVRALVEHYATGGPRTALVSLLHPPAAAVAAATARAQEEPPVLRFVGEDGWEQTVWPVPDSVAGALTEALGRARHYVADGHHRVAASLRIWEAAGRPSGATVMCAMYPFGGLRISAFHRRLVGPVPPDGLWAVLSDGFEVRTVPGAEPGPTAAGTFGLYVAGRWYDITHTGERLPGAGGLDVAILDSLVLEPLLGADGRRTRVEIAADPGVPAGQVAACDRDGGALFRLRPPTLEQLVEVADRHEVMPPKTTCFAPKPYAGVFLR